MTMPGHADASCRPRRRRWLLVFVLAVVLLAVAAFVRFAWLRITLEPTPRPEYWQAEMAKLDPPPPGALSDDETRDLLSDRSWETHPALTSFNKFDAGNLLAGSWSTTRPEVAAADKVFQSDVFIHQRERMKDAVQKGWYLPFSLGSMGIDTTSFANSRQWAMWLAVHARWATESQGDPGSAEDDWLTVLRLARQVRRPRVDIPEFVAAAIEALVADEMMLAAGDRFGLPDTAQFARQVEEILGPTLKPSQLVAGERLYTNHLIDSQYVRKGGDWLAVSEAASHTRAAWMAGKPPQVSRIWNLVSPLYYDIHAARRMVDDRYSSLDACTDIASCQRIDSDQPGAPSIARLNALSGFYQDWTFGSPSIDVELRALFFHYDSRCRIEAGLTMLALSEYHRRHGQYPEQLEQLVPDLLPRLPIDYADRKTLRYRRTGETYILYSVGANGVDDGGRAGPRDPLRFDPENPDTVFSAIKRGEVQP